MTNKKTKYLNKEEILKIIKSLACSQGFYGRILKAIENDGRCLEVLEKAKLKDAVDLVLYLEC